MQVCMNYGAAYKAWYKTMRKEDGEACEEASVQEPCEGPKPCLSACLPLRKRRSPYCVCCLVVLARNEKRRRRRSFFHGWLHIFVGRKNASGI